MSDGAKMTGRISRNRVLGFTRGLRFPNGTVAMDSSKCGVNTLKYDYDGTWIGMLFS